jgi:uncharacterized delta-60 repeat protein
MKTLTRFLLAVALHFIIGKATSFGADQSVSIAGISNAPYVGILPGFPQGSTTILGGVTFDLPSSRPGWESNVNSALPDLSVPLTTNIPFASSVHLLLNTGNTYVGQMQVGDEIGNVVLSYASGPSDVVPLRVGINIREQGVGTTAQTVINTFTDSNLHEVWRGNNNGGVESVVDMLTIPISGLRTLTGITFADQSQAKIAQTNPVLTLKAVTVRQAFPGDVDSLDAAVTGNYVNASAVQPDGKIIIAGSFTSVLGQTRHNIARFNADGTLDTDFNPDTGGVNSVAVQADGKILLGGSFTSVGGIPRNNIARLNADGALDTGFNPNVSNSPNSSYVFSVAVQADGKILLGGAFTSVGGIPRNNIARLNADGALDTGFNPDANSTVTSVAVQADGKILLGGAFTSVGGIPRNSIARVNANSMLDSGFNPNVNIDVRSVAVQADGRILLGGNYDGSGGSARNSIMRVDADGTLDAGFNPKVSYGNDTAFDFKCVNSVAVQADGKILLGGRFTSVGGFLRNNIARLNADGALDAGFNPNANSTVNSVAVQADGKILLGGDFTAVNGTITRNLFARLLNDAATQTLNSLNATQVAWTRSGSSPEVSQVTFEKSTDSGATWTLLGNGNRIGTNANWRLTGLSLPTIGQLRARGRTADGSGLIEQVAAIGPWDTTAPVVAAHANVSVEASSAAGATVNYAAGSATDDVGVTSLTYSQNSGTVFPIGVTTVTITAQDAADNAGTGTFTVTVLDTTAPVVVAHANLTVEATSAVGATVNYAAGSATDAVGVTSLTYSQNGGTVFPIGVTTVTITAQDAANNTGNGTFTVTVRDTTAPVVAAHANVTVEATSAAGATVTYADGSATDAVGVTSLTYSQNSGTTFPIGTTTVTITAKDAANKQGTRTFTVTVSDTTAPVVAAHANVSVMATGSGGSTVIYTTGSATDAVGMTSLTYSKNSGTVFPIGTTTVTITAKDAANNTGAGTFTVTVIAWKEVDGTYQGLLVHDNSANSDEPRYPGRITVSLIKLGAMTGKLEYRGLTYSFSGKFTPELNYLRTIQRKNQGPLTLSIHFDTSSLTLSAQISEFIQSGNIISDATMLLHSFNALKNPAPQAGRYTARIKQGTTSTGGPDAPGYALATISKSGVVKIKGKMSDGSALSCSALLNEDGSSAFYDPLYKAAYPYAGYLAGSMTFDPGAGLQAVTGNLEWQKPAQTKGVFWPQGFRQTREVEGSRYIPPIRGQRVLSLTDLSGAMTFTASGPANFTNNFLLTTANHFLLVDMPNTRKLALKFVPDTGLATGLITGSFYDSTLRKTRKLQGVVLQAQGEINGYFLGDTDAGEWTLSPP